MNIDAFQAVFCIKEIWIDILTQKVAITQAEN